jgi:aspartate racemase
MKKARCLGLIGGLGVGAAVYYYEQLAKAHEARGYGMDLAMVHAETARIFEFIEAKDRVGMASYLRGFLMRMKAAGAELGVIPALTPGYCVRELKEISPLPLIDMFAAINADMAQRRLERVAVFGTRYSINSRLFDLLEGTDIVTPAPDEVELIHSCYAELLSARRATNTLHRSLSELAHRLIARERLDAIVLAGTDFAILFNESNTDFPVVDCASLHLKSIADVLMGE